MNIKHPELIFLVALIPACVVFFFFVWRRRKEVLTRLCDLSKLKTLFPTSSQTKVLTRYSLLIFSFVLFITALISPRWGYDWQEVESKGANIYIALDVSKSMLAEDIGPNRLTRAKHELIKLLDKVSGDRVGLIVFAGQAFLQTPLTHDYLMVKEWLARVTTDSVSAEGTSVKAAVELALKGFKGIESEAKVIVLVSDGEEFDKETVAVIKKAAAEGVKIYTIGVGTSKGAPISLPEGLVTDKNGDVVVSKLDDAFLREIADLTEAQYHRSTTGDFHINTLYFDHIKKELPAEVLKSGKTKVWYETYQIFMAVALFALLLELLLTLNLSLVETFKSMFVRMRRKSLAKTKQGYNFVLPLLLSLGLFSGASANILDWNLHKGDGAMKKEDYAAAKESYLKVQVKDPHNPRLNYNLGVASLKLGAGQEALNAFAQAAEMAGRKELKAKAYYNLGNVLYWGKKYKEAVGAYERALVFEPNHENALYNIERAKAMVEEMEKCPKDQQQPPPPQPQQPPPPEEQNQDQNKPKEEEPKTDLSKEEVESLLKQIQEKPPQDGGSKGKGKGGNSKKPEKWW